MLLNCMGTKMQINDIQIGSFLIGQDHPPFVIAELSGNHNGSIERAMDLVRLAATTGAQAVKLQTYTAETMTIDVREREFFIDDENSLWAGHSLYELYEQAHTPWEWHKPLFDLAAELGMTAFSSPFDQTAVDFLEGLDVPAYKIASFELTDTELVAYVAQTGKPLIMSTGMASLNEIDTAVRVARKNGAGNIILLKCTSSYPAQPEDAHLATIPVLRDAFQCQVGLSDHSMGLALPAAAVTLGATVIEKHFTNRRAEGGVDSAFSLEPEEFRELVETTANVRKAIGEVRFGGGASETTSKSHRRSLYVTQSIAAGTVITRNNVRSIRPGLGLPVEEFEKILGLKVSRDVERGTPVSWDLFR